LVLMRAMNDDGMFSLPRLNVRPSADQRLFGYLQEKDAKARRMAPIFRARVAAEAIAAERNRRLLQMNKPMIGQKYFI
jgi:hypothetical protein